MKARFVLSLMGNGKPVPILVNSGKAAVLTVVQYFNLDFLGWVYEHKMKFWDQSHISIPELMKTS